MKGRIAALAVVAVIVGLAGASSAAGAPAGDLDACQRESSRVALTVITSLDDAWATSIPARDAHIRAIARADPAWVAGCREIDPDIVQDWLRSAGAMTLICHLVAEQPGNVPPGHAAFEALAELEMTC